jgi:hypothetical protein
MVIGTRCQGHAALYFPRHSIFRSKVPENRSKVRQIEIIFRVTRRQVLVTTSTDIVLRVFLYRRRCAGVRVCVRILAQSGRKEDFVPRV